MQSYQNKQIILFNALLRDRNVKSIPGFERIALDWSLDKATRKKALHEIYNIGGETALSALRSISHKADDQIATIARKMVNKHESKKVPTGEMLPLTEGALS